jgi:hypothetical protein
VLRWNSEEKSSKGYAQKMRWVFQMFVTLPYCHQVCVYSCMLRAMVVG